MKKAYVYGMAGLVTAAVGVTAASGLFDGSESAAGEQAAPAALANPANAPQKQAPAAQPATPKPSTVRVVPAAPAAQPAVQPAPVAKVTKPEARTAVHQPHKKTDRQVKRPVVRAATAHATPRIDRQAKPIALVVAAKPKGGSVADTKKALDNAAKAVENAKRLVEGASTEVEHAKSELGKVQHDLEKRTPHAKKTKRAKDKPDLVRKAKDRPGGAVTGSTKDPSNKVSVSLDSSQVKPGESRTITKSTSDGSAWSSVTVTRK